MTPIIVALAFGYLLGSIPFGLLITRAAGLGDVRSIGSGNIGATNVLRTGRKELAALTLLLDALKGTAAVLAATALWGAQAGLAAGLAAFFGHLFPVWLGFRGGKGVATYLGVVAAFAWQAGLVFAAVWLCVAFLFRYSSLSALATAVVVPVALYLLGLPSHAAAAAVMSVLLFVMHRANIGRLLAGTEGKIGVPG